jgi:hypothetical protein
MVIMDMVRNDIIDLEPAEFIRMKTETPEEIKEVKIIPPVLGRAGDFGKIRVRLSIPRYEVRL